MYSTRNITVGYSRDSRGIIYFTSLLLSLRDSLTKMIFFCRSIIFNLFGRFNIYFCQVVKVRTTRFGLLQEIWDRFCKINLVIPFRGLSLKKALILEHLFLTGSVSRLHVAVLWDRFYISFFFYRLWESVFRFINMCKYFWGM